ncbi:MAG: hypothetical protein NTW86_11930 [Candidatus Sumerlaeota bacterium]|nr:hypothetical protein [Candidatus Sumerlaeota bacterium]
MNDDRLICAACCTSFVSAQSFAGVCSECGAKICYKCWSTGVRGCRLHGAPKTASPETGKRTGGSLTDLVRPHETAGAAARGGNRRLPGSDGRGPAVAGAAPELPDNAITIDQCRYLETLFVRHIQGALRGIARYPGEPGLRRRRLTEKQGRPVGDPPGGAPTGPRPKEPPVAEIAARLPSNRCIHFKALFGSRLPWSKQRVQARLVVASYVPLQPLLEKGYVIEPASSRELGVVVEHFDRLDRAAGFGLVFSPTGWDASVKVPDGMGLVALDSDCRWQVRHNLCGVPRALVSALLEGQSDEQRMKRCVAALEQAPVARFPLSARAFALEHDLPLVCVAEAFRRAAQPGSKYIVCDDSGREDWLLELQ